MFIPRQPIYLLILVDKYFNKLSAYLCVFHLYRRKDDFISLVDESFSYHNAGFVQYPGILSTQLGIRINMSEPPFLTLTYV